MRNVPKSRAFVLIKYMEALSGFGEHSIEVSCFASMLVDVVVVLL